MRRVNIKCAFSFMTEIPRNLSFVFFSYCSHGYLNSCLAQTVQISIYVFILCICYVIYFENLKYNLVYVRTSRWRKIAGSAWLLLFIWANHVNSGITGWKIKYTITLCPDFIIANFLVLYTSGLTLIY